MDDLNDSNGPNDPLNSFREALSCNLQYTSSLKKQLNELRLQLLCNLEKQRLLKSHRRIKIWESYSSKRRCAIMRREKFFSSPFHIYIVNKIKNIKGNEYEITEPNNNSDTKYWLKKSKIKNTSNTNTNTDNNNNQELMEYVPVFHLSKNLSKMEKNIIITSARCEYIEKAKQKLMKKSREKAKTIENTFMQQNELRNELSRLDKCVPIDIDSNLLDWDRISKFFISKHCNKLSDDIAIVKYRSASEYKRIWNNYILSDNTSWSKKEIKYLTKIVHKNAGYNWFRIHKEFVNKLIVENIFKNRSILSLIGYYQQSINKIHTRHDWTRVDDEILIKIALKYGDNDNLSQSYYLDRRLPHQCCTRLQHATGGDYDSHWNKLEELTLILLIAAHDGNVKWGNIKQIMTLKTDSQCREKYNNYLKNVICDDEKMDLNEIIFICNILYKDKSNLWNKWCDISYVLNWYEYNYWNNAYRKWIKRNKNDKNQKFILQLKKDKINNHKYFNPSTISYLFCVLFGGKCGHKLFDDNDYCEELLKLFCKLKDFAIQCQENNNNNNCREQINQWKEKIKLHVNHNKFIFDKLIKNVVTQTVYFDDNIDAIENYKFLMDIDMDNPTNQNAQSDDNND